MTERCDRLAAAKVNRIVKEFGWISVLRSLALVRASSRDKHSEVYTPEYVTACYERWIAGIDETDELSEESE